MSLKIHDTFFDEELPAEQFQQFPETFFDIVCIVVAIFTILILSQVRSSSVRESILRILYTTAQRTNCV